MMKYNEIKLHPDVEKFLRKQKVLKAFKLNILHALHQCNNYEEDLNPLWNAFIWSFAEYPKSIQKYNMHDFWADLAKLRGIELKDLKERQ